MGRHAGSLRASTIIDKAFCDVRLTEGDNEEFRASRFCGFHREGEAIMMMTDRFRH